MKMLSHYILTLLLVLLALPLWAAPQDGYNLSYLNMSSGMPNNFVDDIHRDSYGFMWISTHGGLLRYDGYSFLSLGLGSNVGLPLRSNSCRNVVEDKFGRLWVAFDECVQVIDLRKMHESLPEATSKVLKNKLIKIMDQPCMRVFADSKGCIWILTVDEIERITFDDSGCVNSVMALSHHTKVPDLAMADLDDDGSVYVGINLRMTRVFVRNGKLVAQDLSSRYPQLNGTIVGTIAKWKGKVWFGTGNGLYNSDRGNTGWHFSLSNGLQHETVTTLAVSPNGNDLIVGTLGGVDFLNSDFKISDHWNTASVINPLSSNFVSDIYVGGGQVWVGTETGGITHIVPRQLSLHNYIHISGVDGSLSSGPVNSMLVAPNGDLWVGTVEGGLNFMRSGGSSFEHFTKNNSGLLHNSVSALASDGKGNLWIGTWGGGVCSMEKALTVTGMANGGKEIVPLTSDSQHQKDLLYIGVLAYDPYNDGMWIGANAGLFFYDFKTKLVRDPFPGCRSINGAIGSIVTKDGKLFMGCMTGMVSVNLRKGADRKGNFSFTHYIYKLDNPSSRAFEKISAFCQSSNGTIWIGSNGYGLYRVEEMNGDSLTVKNYTTNDGLANNSVKGIVEGNHGNIWIATENGLSRLDPEAGTFNNFTVEDGLLSNQFYFNGAVRGAGSAIYLGSDKGLTRLDGVVSNDISNGHLRLTALIVNNQLVLPGSGYLDEWITFAKRIRIHEGDRSFEIRFSALTYGGEARGIYYYRMRGYEDDWIALPAGEHSVRYSTLPSGHYTFEVRYTSPLSGSKVQTASVKVVVMPYFYKSWWFILIIIFFFIAIATYLYNKRLEQVRNREAELLYRPIEAAIKDSPEPDKLQERIQAILRNQERYRESQQRTVEEDKDETVKKSKNEEPLMARIMSVMEREYADPELNVQMLADAVGVGRTELGKALKNELGTSTTQFIRDYRLDVAKRLLEDNFADRNITEIAYRVGFNDPKYFTRCFTHRFGMAPSSYKKD